MKTLYINIRNKQIQSNEEFEVLKHDLDSDFFFYLGGKIAKGYKVENEIALITDFNILDYEKDYKQIIAQWNEIKTILFSEECGGKFELTLPDGYIHWLKLHPQYVSVYDRSYSNGESTVITIDLKELYEESVEDLQGEILYRLKRDDLYLDIDEIVFNDDAVTLESPIVSAIKEKYDGIGFKSYKKVNKVYDFFPYKGFNLGEIITEKIKGELFSNGTLYDLGNNVILFKGDNSDHFIAAIVNSKMSYIYDDLPIEWSNLLGCKFGTSHEDCCRALSEKKFEIILNENAEIVVVSPNKKYRMHLLFDVDGDGASKFSIFWIMLNECPHCKSDDLILRGIIDNEMHISYCANCDKPYISFMTVESEEIIEVVDNKAPNCPKCDSVNVEDDGSDYLQYTCNDCGHFWGNPKHDVCPECGSNEVVDYGTGYLQYECKSCGMVWGHYDKECPTCGSNDIEDDGTNTLNYRCNKCGQIWENNDDSENEEYDNDQQDEYDDDTDNAGNLMSEYIESLGVILDRSTKSDVESMGGVLVDSNYGKYKMPNGIHVYFLNNSCTVDNVTIYKNDINGIPQFYKNLGIYWGIDKFGFKHIFENLGFHVVESEYVQGHITAYKPCMKYNVYICIKFIYDSLGLTRDSGEYLSCISISTWNINCRPY